MALLYFLVDVVGESESYRVFSTYVTRGQVLSYSLNFYELLTEFFFWSECKRGVSTKIESSPDPSFALLEIFCFVQCFVRITHNARKHGLFN